MADDAGMQDAKADAGGALAQAGGSMHQRKRLGKRLFSYVEDGEEFRFLDYTPCINRRPMDLPGEMRVTRMGRQIKLFVCVTVYDEEIELLRRTLESIAAALPYLKDIGVTWQEVAVCVIVDGRFECNDRLLDYAAGILVYDETMIEVKHNGYDATMHIFEKSVHLPKHQTQREYYAPMQMIFCVKERNGGKLNSHLWFTALVKKVRPKYMCFFQCGNKTAADDGLARLYQTLEDRPTCGGVGGSTNIYRATVCNPVEGAQVFQNKVLDPLTLMMESVFGYIRGLSGELAMYRWDAVRSGPLQEYFMMEEHTLSELGPLVANMYLTEDEVLAFGILVAQKQAWTTHFVSTVECLVPGKTTLLDYMKSRKKFTNGSFLMWAHYVSKFWMVWKNTKHGFLRKLLLSLQFVFNALQVGMEWFMMGFYYLAMISLFNMTFPCEKQSDGSCWDWVFMFNIPYIFLVGANIIYGLGSTMQRAQHIYAVSTLLYGLTIILAAAATAFHVWQGNISDLVLYAGISVLAGHVVGAILSGQIVHLCMTAFQYMFMMPSLVNMLTIFSFCNMHDISWATRQGNYLMESKRPRATNPAKEAKQRKEASNIANALVKIVGSTPQNSSSKGILRTEDSFSNLAHVVKKAVETEQDEDEARQWAKVQAEMLKQHVKDQATFSAFRNRLMAMWLGTNIVFIIVILQFKATQMFASGLGGGILLFMVFKILGTVFYHLERVARTTCAICCPCIWNRGKNKKRGPGAPPAVPTQATESLAPSRFITTGVDTEAARGVDGAGLESLSDTDDSRSPRDKRSPSRSRSRSRSRSTGSSRSRTPPSRRHGSRRSGRHTSRSERHLGSHRSRRHHRSRRRSRSPYSDSPRSRSRSRSRSTGSSHSDRRRSARDRDRERGSRRGLREDARRSSRRSRRERDRDVEDAGSAGGLDHAFDMAIVEEDKKFKEQQRAEKRQSVTADAEDKAGAADEERPNVTTPSAPPGRTIVAESKGGAAEPSAVAEAGAAKVPGTVESRPPESPADEK